jgi:peptide/nickel transport system ATP-binding protein/oligopeptide transport system ATP-binding protein
MSDVLLEAVNVAKVYPLRSGVLRRPIGDVLAVDQVNCSIRRGERLGLVGESGCGKTTLAKLLIGLLRPSRGEVFILGEALPSLRGERLRAARRSIQFIFQDPMNSLNPRMTVEEILSEPLLIHRLTRGGKRRARIEELLTAVQLPAAYLKRLPRQLSGGERQRIGIARALATNPDALLCDEPIASLDVSVGWQILELLRGICRAREMALLFISHDLRAVASLCDRIAVMRQGRFVEVAPTDQLLNHPGHPYTELLIRSATLDLDAATESLPDFR